MTKLPTVLMVPGGPGWCQAHGVTWQVECYLLKWLNVSLGNTGNSPFDMDGNDFFPDAKHIAPMFSYQESRINWPKTYEELKEYGLLENEQWYLYDCGDGDYLGTDEPGTRGDKAYRAFDWGRAYQRVYDALIDYPGLKPVVTMPLLRRKGGLVDCGDIICGIRSFSDFGNAIARAFDTHAIEMARINYNGNWIEELTGFQGVPGDDFEIWAYNALYKKDPAADPYRPPWGEQETPTPCNRPGEMGTWLHERGVSAYLHNTSLKYLIDDTKPPRQMLRPNALAMLEGM